MNQLLREHAFDDFPEAQCASSLSRDGGVTESIVSERRIGLSASLCFAAAAIALGHALQIANGFYDPFAVGWLTAALLLTLGGVLLTRAEPVHANVMNVSLRAVVVIGVAWQLVSLLMATPAFYLRTADLTLFRAGVCAEALCIAAGYVRASRLDRLWFPALLTIFAGMGVWIVRESPSPWIDVVTVHRAAISALVHGRNPYDILFRNIYGDASFYNPSLATRTLVTFGYPYPPMSLLGAVPGQLLARDYRYAELAAILAAAAFIGYTRPDRTSKLAAVLLLTTPRVFFVLEQGWSEPIALVLLAATAFCLARKPACAGWVAGLFAVTKQYLIMAVPLIVRIGSRQASHRLQFFAQALLAACAVTLPFVVWRFRPFVDAVVLLQFREPVRIDSLSYLSWAARAGWDAGSIYWPITAAASALVVGLVKTPNTAAGFVASLALTMFTMFAFGSKAFCNYYFFVIGALCCALSVGSSYSPPVAALTRQ